MPDAYRGAFRSFQDFERLQASIKQRDIFGKPADAGFPKNVQSGAVMVAMISALAR